jgi:hypothetical protein
MHLWLYTLFLTTPTCFSRLLRPSSGCTKLKSTIKDLCGESVQKFITFYVLRSWIDSPHTNTHTHNFVLYLLILYNLSTCVVNKQLYNHKQGVLCCPSHQMFGWSRQENKWAWHVARMGERRGAHRALVGKPEGRRPLEKPRRRWKNNIKMDLRDYLNAVIWDVTHRKLVSNRRCRTTYRSHLQGLTSQKTTEFKP